MTGIVMSREVVLHTWSPSVVGVL